MSPCELTGETAYYYYKDGCFPVYDKILWRWGTSLCGIYMQHNYYLYEVLNYIFLGKDLKAVVEIGTGHGALSVVLGLWGKLLDIPVMSLDIEPPLDFALKLLDVLDVKYFKQDCFSSEVIEAVKDFPFPQYLVCDGGDKPRELQTFSKLLKPGSYISVHDWGVEVVPKDAEGLPLEPFLPELWTRNNVQYATWRVV